MIRRARGDLGNCAHNKETYKKHLRNELSENSLNMTHEQILKSIQNATSKTIRRISGKNTSGWYETCKHHENTEAKAALKPLT